MEILNVNLPANGRVQMRKGGAYIEILSSVGPIEIDLYTSSGGQSNSIKGGMSGLYLNANFGAMDVVDVSGSAQTVQLLVCDTGETGGSRRQPGNVRVIDEFFDALQCVAYGSDLTVKAFLTTTIVAPAANLKGLIVRWLIGGAQAGAGGSSGILLEAAKSAPTQFGTPAQRYPLLQLVNPTTTAQSSSLTMNKLIPPGWGLYVSEQIQVSAATVCSVNFGYDIVV